MSWVFILDFSQTFARTVSVKVWKAIEAIRRFIIRFAAGFVNFSIKAYHYLRSSNGW